MKIETDLSEWYRFHSVEKKPKMFSSCWLGAFGAGWNSLVSSWSLKWLSVLITCGVFKILIVCVLRVWVWVGEGELAANRTVERESAPGVDSSPGGNLSASRLQNVWVITFNFRFVQRMDRGSVAAGFPRPTRPTYNPDLSPPFWIWLCDLKLYTGRPETI